MDNLRLYVSIENVFNITNIRGKILNWVHILNIRL